MPRFIDNLRNKNFLRLWSAQVISQFGDRVNQMALIGLMASRFPGSAVGIAKILVCTILPVFLIGPVAAVYVDRWDRRRTLFICDIIRGLVVLSIPLYLMNFHSMVPIYIAVFLAFCLSRFYVPAKLSIIPDLVEKRNLLIANSLVTVSGMIAFVLGCAFGGIIVEQIGPRGGFVWDAITFFISAGLVFSITVTKIRLSLDRKRFLSVGQEAITIIKKSVIEEIKEGIRYLGSQKRLRFIINMMFVLFAAAGAIYVVIIVFIQETFKTMTRDLGFLAVFLGLGLFAGSLLYGRLGEKISRFKTIFFSLIFGGIMVMVFAFSVQKTHSFGLAAALSFILGLIVGPIFIAANTVVHQVADDKMRGKVFGAMEIVMHAAFLLTMLISSVLSEYIARFWILTVVGFVFAGVGAAGLVRYQKQSLI